MTWPIVQLKEYARIVGGATPKSEVGDYWNGDIPWTTPKDLSDLDGKFISDTPRKITEQGLRNCSSEILPPNSVLFSSRAPIGHVAINTVPMATNQGFKSMVPGPKLDASFLYWWLKCHRTQLEQLGNGATFKEVSKAVVERIEIPLPPLEEQKRIAAILDQADELRRKRQHALDRLNQLGQAIFIEMFGDLLLSSDKAVALGEVCDVRDGTHESPKYVDVGFPLLTSKNFSSGSIDYAGANLISESDFISINKRSKVDKGDIIMPMIGTIGGPVIVDFDPDFAIKNVALIKFKNSKMNQEFIREVLDGPLFKSHVASAGRGGTQKFVSLGDIRGFKIPFASIEQQNLFASRVSLLRNERARYVAAQRRNETLFASLQHRAFRGELMASSLKEAAA